MPAHHHLHGAIFVKSFTDGLFERQQLAADLGSTAAIGIYNDLWPCLVSIDLDLIAVQAKYAITLSFAWSIAPLLLEDAHEWTSFVDQVDKLAKIHLFEDPTAAPDNDPLFAARLYKGYDFIPTMSAPLPDGGDFALPFSLVGTYYYNGALAFVQDHEKLTKVQQVCDHFGFPLGEVFIADDPDVDDPPALTLPYAGLDDLPSF